jgi:hypothetical protein
LIGYVLALALSCAAAASEPALRDVVVGSNWEGTAEFRSAHIPTLKKINLIRTARNACRNQDAGLRRRLAFWFVRTVPGEGCDQLVDDLFPSSDGHSSAPRAPALRMSSRWTSTPGRCLAHPDRSVADHAAISPDGKTFLVSPRLRERWGHRPATGKISPTTNPATSRMNNCSDGEAHIPLVSARIAETTAATRLAQRATFGSSLGRG